MLGSSTFDRTSYPSRPLLIGLTSALTCAALCWSESTHYQPLDASRLSALVGLKGDCCIPPQKESCESVIPYTCGGNAILCDYGSYTLDECSPMDCKESKESRDHCDSQEFGESNVSLTWCMVTSSAPMYCGDDGSQCAYVTGVEVHGIYGCGTASICRVSAGGASCQ